MRNISVLAIDDNHIDLESLNRHLSACEEFNVTFNGFQDWESGLRALADEAADVVFLDYYMEEVTGPELLKKIQERAVGCPVIMLTGSGDEETATKSIRSGASDYISKKKLSPEVLRHSIEKVHREQALQAEKRYLEREHRANRHLESLDTLAGGMAHDFNNLLAGILASAELAKFHEPSEIVVEELDRIMSIVHSGKDLIQRLLRFNTFNGIDEDINYLDMGEVVKDTFSVLTHAKPMGIQIHMVRNSTDVLYVRGRSARLHQVVLNLCVNAIEAMEHAGELEVALNRVHIDGRDKERHRGVAAGDYVLLLFSDTGPGIPPEIQERLFEPFFTTKEVGGRRGRGLGLSTVWDGVREMGGTIRVHSELNEGTTFFVYLPLADTQERLQAIGCSVERCGTEEILLVDTEPVVRETVGGLLAQLGYNVYRAGTLDEARVNLDRADSNIEMVIIDGDIPDEAFRERLRAFRAAPQGGKVIQALRFAERDETDVISNREVDGVVHKPFLIRHLAKEIRAVFDGTGP